MDLPQPSALPVVAQLAKLSKPAEKKRRLPTAAWRLSTALGFWPSRLAATYRHLPLLAIRLELGYPAWRLSIALATRARRLSTPLAYHACRLAIALTIARLAFGYTRLAAIYRRRLTIRLAHLPTAPAD